MKLCMNSQIKTKNEMVVPVANSVKIPFSWSSLIGSISLRLVARLFFIKGSEHLLGRAKN